MKIGDIEIERQLEATPVENDAQRELREAIEYAGTRGQRWCVDYQDNNGRHCALGLVARTRGVRLIMRRDGTPSIKALARAAIEMGGEEFECDEETIAGFNNSSTFPTVRKLFKRAIELAA